MSLNGSRWKQAADWSMLLLGLAGAAWEIFHDRSQNPYVYALILALLRIGQGLSDKLDGILGKRS